ncbi:uncharacterized protein RCC_05253 [Ramularia collo-cygni]|uniref:Heterokaryon incompatibility domain-containing protein n=1 Tax=Ramularia collo-cygni TaxID=112498 RepID=A0A2D3VFH5_9PEZI|nr:uncharacterized protein RCC_05253 [Ramularia collo-cygni]CZT19403.1 uncharacterized protein RCC_05253 [Ramularia collo-cygni]
MAPQEKTIPSAIYTPLNAAEQEIRLITIAPSSLDSAVRVTLRTVPHALVKGKYHCLSYAWGNNDDPMPIMINGHRSLVRCNLYSLIRRLRASKRATDIWIDALCINQDDKEEKASQVYIMQAIYSEAAGVLIGLDDSRSQIMADIPGQHALAAATLQGLADGSHLNDLAYFAAQPRSNKAFREVSSSFGQILDSRWFGRTWVVQETCLAKKAILLFPSGELDWEVFEKAFVKWNQHSRECCQKFTNTLSDDLVDACNRMYLHVKCIAYTRNGLKSDQQHITEPMLNYQHLELSDHRDKIYAFRGLHTELTLPLPEPDYGSNEKTFMDFVLWYLEDKQSLLILGFDMCFGEVANLHLPSWVPTWPTFTAEQGIERGNLAKARGKFLDCYNAAAGLKMAYRWNDSQRNHLQLNGFKINDKIIAVSENHFSGNEKFPDRLELMKTWYQFTYEEELSSFQNLPTEFCITILAGIILNDPKTGGKPHPLHDENDLTISELKSTFTGMERQGSQFRCTASQKILIHSQNVALLDRVMFRTEEGRMGIGPSGVKPGDEIFVLGGGSAPFVLRRVDDADFLGYRLVGHAYVHGIMNGEVVVHHGGGQWVDLV